MNNRELDEILKSASVPERTEKYWAEFAQRVVGEIQERDRRPGRGGSRSADGLVRAPTFRPAFWKRLLELRLLPAWPAYAAAFALVALAAGFATGFWKVPRSAAADPQLVEAQEYFRELEGLFPHQLRAVVFSPDGAHLVLGEQADVPASPPVYLKIRGPEGLQRFITFSGQQIRLDGEVCDVLLDRQGNVLVVGRQVVWSSAAPAGHRGPYRIEAQTLAGAS